ncbi:MAG: hypothetical protein ACW981_11745 [Candidatus Hodarchaeales archaeon]|jgi:hypothetical protein
MSKIVEISVDDMKQLIKIGRLALLSTFVLIIIMLFHVLVDFFYHT